MTTAYYLARAGHCVEVLERRENVACETSYANAGQVSPGYSAPWAGPGIPLKASKWLSMQHGPLVMRALADPAMWSWLSRMLRNCTSARYEVNKGRMLSLAEYSRDCLRELRAETGITYDERSLGTLQLFRTAKQLDGVARDIEILREFGVEHRLLDQVGCISAEPDLAHSSAQFVGGLPLPGDETGTLRYWVPCLAQHVDCRDKVLEAVIPEMRQHAVPGPLQGFAGRYFRPRRGETRRWRELSGSEGLADGRISLATRLSPRAATEPRTLPRCCFIAIRKRSVRPDDRDG